jgi:hypothetical protein
MGSTALRPRKAHTARVRRPNTLPTQSVADPASPAFHQTSGHGEVTLNAAGPRIAFAGTKNEPMRRLTHRLAGLLGGLAGDLARLDA